MGTGGRGQLAPFTRGAWAGWKYTARVRFIHLDGRKTRTSDVVSVVLVRDRITVHVRVSTWLPVRSRDSSARIAEEQLSSLIAGLEQRGGEPG